MEIISIFAKYLYGFMINKDINTFEIHYILPPDVHQMDASVEAQCTLQYVKIIKKVAELLQLEVEIDTIAIEEGGLRHWLKIVKEKEDKDATITSDVLKHLLKTISVATVTGAWMWVTGIFKSCSSTEVADQCIQYWEQHHEKFENYPPIQAYRAGFYKPLLKEPSVERVEFNTFDQECSSIISNDVPRSSFLSLSKYSQVLEPEIDDAAIIQITAPVLTKGKYNTWHGIYNGQQIAFEMQSAEFKTQVQQGAIKFVNGTCIKCSLEYSRTLLESGEIKNDKYKVRRVDCCYDSDAKFETLEGKRYKAKKDQEAQPNLFTFLD